MTDISSTTTSIPTVGRGGIRRGLRGLRSEISIHSDLSIGLTEIQPHRFGLGQAYLGLPGLILGSIRGRCRRGKGGGSIPTDGLLMKCIQFQAITVLQEREMRSLSPSLHEWKTSHKQPTLHGFSTVGSRTEGALAGFHDFMKMALARKAAVRSLSFDTICWEDDMLVSWTDWICWICLLGCVYVCVSM